MRIGLDGVVDHGIPLAPLEGLEVAVAIAGQVLVFCTIVAGGYMAGTQHYGRPDYQLGDGAHHACGTQFPGCNGSFMPFGESRLGRLWQLLTPLVNAGVYFLIFGVILGTRGRVPNFIGYLCVGVFVFNFTMLVLAAAVQSISGQLDLVRALQFPRASLPIAMTLVQLQNLIGSIVVLSGIMVATGEVVTTKWLWLIPAMVLESFFNLGLALFVARLGLQFRWPRRRF